MKDKSQDKTIYQSLSQVREKLVSIKANKSDILIEDIDEAIFEIDFINKALKGLKNLLFILFSFVSVLLIYLVYTEYYRVEVREFNNKIDSFKQDSIIREILDIKIDTIGDTISTHYEYKTNNKNVVKYSDLVKENDSLDNLLSLNKLEKDSVILSLSHKVSNYEIMLRLLENNYPISFKETKKNISIYGPQVDSALILLENFRHNMKYNPNSKSWYITR